MKNVRTSVLMKYHAAHSSFHFKISSYHQRFSKTNIAYFSFALKCKNISPFATIMMTKIALTKRRQMLLCSQHYTVQNNYGLWRLEKKNGNSQQKTENAFGLWTRHTNHKEPSSTKTQMTENALWFFFEFSFWRTKSNENKTPGFLQQLQLLLLLMQTTNNIKNRCRKQKTQIIHDSNCRAAAL